MEQVFQYISQKCPKNYKTHSPSSKPGLMFDPMSAHLIKFLGFDFFCSKKKASRFGPHPPEKSRNLQRHYQNVHCKLPKRTP